MCRSQCHHSLETEIELGQGPWGAGGAEAFAAMAAMDPAGREAEAVGRNMVVEQAFRDVENVAARDALLSKVGEHVLDRRPVRSDVCTMQTASNATPRRALECASLSLSTWNAGQLAINRP